MSAHEIDPAKYISDHYFCPLCKRMIAGFMAWASHTAQIHDLSVTQFEKKYGYKRYFYGQTLQDEKKGEEDPWNPTQR